jgi:hypothetical protein
MNDEMVFFRPALDVVIPSVGAYGEAAVCGDATGDRMRYDDPSHSLQRMMM